MAKRRRITSFEAFQFPMDYFSYTEEEKKEFCNNIIEVLLIQIDKELDPEFDRFVFLNDIFDVTIESNEKLEFYEACEIIKDCKKCLNEA